MYWNYIRLYLSGFSTCLVMSLIVVPVRITKSKIEIYFNIPNIFLNLLQLTNFI